MLRVPATLLEEVGYIILTLLWCTSRVSSLACWFAPSRFTSSAPDDGDIGSSLQLVGLDPFVLNCVLICFNALVDDSLP